MIVEYIGEVIRQTVADKREVAYEEEGMGSCYLFRLDPIEIVDATRTGGMARYMNHCCEPNAYAKIITTSRVGPSSLDSQNLAINIDNNNVNNTTITNDVSNDKYVKHIVIMAARNIKAGEEITYDYKFPIEETKLKCYCGAPKCQGTMN
jgi:SET domain-containing protein